MFSEKIKLSGKYFGLLLIVKMVFAIIVLLYSKFDNDIAYLYKSEINLDGTPTTLILVIIILPLVEEFSFRGFLSKTINLIPLSVTVLFIYLFILLTGGIIEVIAPLKLAVLSLSSIAIYLILKSLEEKLFYLLKKNFTRFLIASSVLFGLFHLTNFSTEVLLNTNIISKLIVIAPFCIAGYLFAQVRVKAGLLYSFSIHAINNSLILLVL